MIDEIVKILNFMGIALWNVWPYLLITIPVAVAVQMSGASRYINRAFQARPLIAIFLATAVGAFSPFCSCTVIPVVATLLIGGVPLAPVMSFWIASPSMDPEIFFLSVATLGWNLALWRMGATLLLSISAGLITHLIGQRGWLGRQILRPRPVTAAPSSWTLLKRGWQRVKTSQTAFSRLGFMVGSNVVPVTGPACSGHTGSYAGADPIPTSSCGSDCSSTRSETESSCSLTPPSFRRRLLQETWTATSMVVKFMALAFFLEALIILYIPEAWITALLGSENGGAIVTAALIGIPVYSSNLTALPLVSGLLVQGMNPGAALAFLIAGPVTTLPAMAAVWGLTTRRVFALYVSLSLLGAVSLGYLHSLIG
jgi:hypothetical protein